MSPPSLRTNKLKVNAPAVVETDIQASKSKFTHLTKRLENAEFDLSNLRTAFNKIENSSVASDIIIVNVPNKLDAGDVVAKLFDAVSCNKIVVRKVFRTRATKSNEKSVPIIVKLNSLEDRVELFKALALFRKEHNKQLTLTDFGIADDVNIFVHECLSTLNKEMLRAAIRFKNDKLLVAAYTIRGSVFVKVKIDSKPHKLSNLDDLNKIVGGIA